MVVSTRDCSLQRRHQKLVEEAPAPFLTEDQLTRLYESSKAILKEAGYVGAGTCEFLVGQDGTISFLEVNTRLQVEHPVSEEVTGIDLVREMFRIADGEELGYDDPEIRGHSIEFRINGEDRGRNFMPAPGTAAALGAPGGPGVRVDGGYLEGETIPGSFDSLARQAHRHRPRPHPGPRARPPRARRVRRRRACPPCIPFHRGGRRRPGVVGPSAHGRGPVHRLHPLDRDRVRQPDRAVRRRAPRRPRRPASASTSSSRSAAAASRSCLPAGPRRPGVRRRRRRRAPRSPSGAAKKAGAAASGDAVTSPMQGTIVKVAVEEGQQVAEGDLVVVLEAMKMEQPLKAHKAGTVTGLDAEVGATVTNGAVICELKD